MSLFGGVTAEQLERAMRPTLRFGQDLLPTASRDWGSYLVVTMPEPWAAARPRLEREPTAVHFVAEIEQPAMDALERELPAVDTIVGIGGGLSLDLAKYLAWHRDAQPVLVPSIASVDACVTNTIAVRDDHRVRYVGFVIAREVLVDYRLLQSAPQHLNRAGIGDILSIHTALWDWRAAADRGGIAFDDRVAAEVAGLVDQLEQHTTALREVAEPGLRWLMEAFAHENALCLRVGHSRPEEGSEHFFAYNVEHRTGRSFVHGELVCLGILLMARLQQNAPERVARVLRAVDVRYQPRDLGLTRDEVEGALRTLPAYVADEGLPWSVINQRGIDEATIQSICDDLLYADQASPGTTP
jgi:glycerol-1-phosphate dehydrogenase [NAD(P)+]